jgi:hypothetical protein
LIRRNWVRIIYTFLLGSLLTFGLLYLIAARTARYAPASAAGEKQPAGPAYVFLYTRVQTVTLHAPMLSNIYATRFTTTFEIRIFDYTLGDLLYYPSDAITIAASCEAEPPCQVLWTRDENGEPAAFFTGTGKGNVYLAYNTWSRAFRPVDSPLITLSYPVGPRSTHYHIAITNTIIFTRGTKLHPLWRLRSAEPAGYLYDEQARLVKWVLTDTPRVTFTLTLSEPLLGSNLVIERFAMAPRSPGHNERVHYTVTVRNVGFSRTRGVLAELLVRPLSLGPPVVLTDHAGGWYNYAMDAMFKWEGSDHWWPGLEPGGVITGSTVLTWPDRCEQQPCGVWARVDPSYLGLGESYDWFGYIPEGFECALNERHLPTCAEENNNMKGLFDFFIHLPLVLREFPEF